MSPRTRTKVPKGPIPRRLESLRTDKGLSLLKFHGAVVTATGSDVTYRSVQRYHTEDSAPVQYLMDVANTFEISMDWLCRGLGVPTQVPQDWEGLNKLNNPVQDSADPVVQTALFDTFERVLSAMPVADDGTGGRHSLTWNQRGVILLWLQVIILAPMELLCGGVDRLSQEAVDRYLLHLLEAIRCVIAPVGSGLSYEELVKGHAGMEALAHMGES